ncbi:hypothetical protein CYMTET_51633 [Cymbomonas tetramitiformis]|uniref:Uncharacterized protein n=1 Tax=Cymbomonas tetramitiformis TaxID=36881 RepID=A0AAE0BLW2_9CHLO|nr:hypothetical protein CYMTET_51633 [Cymbomonas tetramitiformis]
MHHTAPLSFYLTGVAGVGTVERRSRSRHSVRNAQRRVRIQAHGRRVGGHVPAQKARAPQAVIASSKADLHMKATTEACRSCQRTELSDLSFGDDEDTKLFNLPTIQELAAAMTFMYICHAEPAHAAVIKELPDWAANLFGVLYLAFFGAFLVRVFKKRAKFVTSTRLASEKTEAAEDDDGSYKPKDPGVLDAIGGAITAGLLCAFFFKGSQAIDATFAGKQLSNDYTAAQITITVRTIISGLAYLATFVFGLNTAGLTALAFKLLIFGPDEAEAEEAEKGDTMDSSEDKGKPAGDE